MRRASARIITAYLNQNFYGHDAYGIASAASTYFGVTDLSKLTPAQAALLAGLPKSPSTLDPYLYATRDKKGRLVVDPTSPPILRRDYILGTLTVGRWTHLTPAEIAAARAEPVVLVGDRPIIYRAPHFMWRVRDELVKHFGSLEAVETGRLSRHHDARLEGAAAGREVHHGGSRAAPCLEGEGRTDRQEPEGLRARPRLGAAAQRARPAQRRDGRHRLPHGRCPGLRRQRWLLPRRDAQSTLRAEVRRSLAGLSTTRLGLQAHRLRDRLRSARADARQPAARRHDALRAWLGAARRRPPRTRTGPGPGGAPVVAQHPGHPGARSRRQQGGRRAGRQVRDHVRWRQQVLRRGGPVRRHRHGRGPTARPHLGLRRPGQQRQARPAALRALRRRTGWPAGLRMQGRRRPRRSSTRGRPTR